MKNEEKFGVEVTQMYANLIKNEVLLKYPNFFFERGSILYDYDNENYIYMGYSEEERKILAEVARSLKIN